MANFRLTNDAPPIYVGGPPNRCSVCKFDNSYPWYLVFDGVYAEEPHPAFGGGWTEVTVMLCSDHATELKGALDEVMPDPKMPALQGKLLKAEAARAKAERRAEAAEKALHAMQDWITEADAK